MHRRGQPFVVRSATVAQLPGVRLVAERTWQATYKGKIPKGQIEQFLERAYSLESLEQSLHRLGAGMLVASSGDQIVGYAMAGPNREGVGELFALYVLPAWQGTGTGHLLWQHATTHLRQGGFTEMVLWVLDRNERARRFYEHEGAIAWTERPFPIGSGTINEIGYRVSLGSGDVV